MKPPSRRPTCHFLFVAALAGAASAGAAEWQHESRGDLRFEYPTLLTLTEAEGRVRLRHALPVRHVDPCILTDTPDPRRDDLVDFDVVLEIVERDLRGALAGEGGSIAERLATSDRIPSSRGFIDAWRFGPLAGYRIWRSVEGCGDTRYYLRLSPRRTLRVTRQTVPELELPLKASRTLRALPRVLLPEQAGHIFDRIVGSVRLAGPNER